MENEDESIEFANVKLDKQCEWCGGDGNGPDRSKCHGCNGAGYQITEAGYALINFLYRHREQLCLNEE